MKTPDELADQAEGIAKDYKQYSGRQLANWLKWTAALIRGLGRERDDWKLRFDGLNAKYQLLLRERK